MLPQLIYGISLKLMIPTDIVPPKPNVRNKDLKQFFFSLFQGQGARGHRGPHLDIHETVESGGDVVVDAVHSTVQGETEAQEDGEDDVGEDGGEVDCLAEALDTPDESEEDDNPGKDQTASNLQSHATHLRRGARSTQVSLKYHSSITQVALKYKSSITQVSLKYHSSITEV